MTDAPDTLLIAWEQRVSRLRGRRREHPVFGQGRVTLGAVHSGRDFMAILSSDKVNDPYAKWSAISALDWATPESAVGWREPIQRQDEQKKAIRQLRPVF